MSMGTQVSEVAHGSLVLKLADLGPVNSFDAVFKSVQTGDVNSIGW